MTATFAPPCADNPELFFSEQAEDVERAKQTCQGCWRLRACQQDIATETPEYGVWAAVNFTPPLTEDETTCKDCTMCGHNKPLVDFRRNAPLRDGHESRCAACSARADAARDHDHRSPGAYAQRRQAHLDTQAIRAVSLRQSGLSYRQIGAQLGVYHQTAMNAVRRAHRKGLVPMEAAS